MVERIKDMKFKKVGDKVNVHHKTQVEDLFYGSEHDKKMVGDVLVDYKYSFESKEKAIEYYEASLTNCGKAIAQFTDEIKNLKEKVVDTSIFDKIEKLKGKLDNSKMKGKYVKLEEYMQDFTKYNTLNNQLKMVERDVPFLNETLKIIKEL